MITANSPKERLRDGLPLVPEGPVTNVEKYRKLIHSLLKKQIVSAVSGAENNLDEELRKILSDMWQGAYSQGLAHMDKMHSKINKELENGK